MSEACKYPHCDCGEGTNIEVRNGIMVFKRWEDNCKEYESKSDNNDRREEE